MKKGILIFLFAMIFLTFGIVFADGGEMIGNITGTKTISALASSTRMERIRQKMKTLAPYIQEIKTNREVIGNLQKNIKMKSGLLRKRLNELSGKETSLQPEELAQLKEHLEYVKPRLANIKNTLGQLRNEEEILKQARENDDEQATSEALNKVLQIQKTRIKELKDLSERLEQLNKQLKSIN